ncbi:MAG: hypothetical protein GY711_04100 [bacterium]|nr:hypothetical protein [bacterium]
MRITAIKHITPTGSTTSTRTPISGERSDNLCVSSDARTLVLRLGDHEVARSAIRLGTGKLEILRLP